MYHSYVNIQEVYNMLCQTVVNMYFAEQSYFKVYYKLTFIEAHIPLSPDLIPPTLSVVGVRWLFR